MTPLTKSSDTKAYVTTTDQCSNCGAVLTNAETARREWQQAACELSHKVERYEKALRELSVLGGGRSEGNFIAQHALK